MPLLFEITCFIAVVAGGLVAGIFLAFSDFLMRSFDRSATVAGAEVMQVINREVFRTLFMVMFIGLVPLSMLLAVGAVFYTDGAARWFVIAGGASYIVGVFGVTAAGNVPMNNRLDGMDHTTEDAATYWKNTYIPRWTRFNTFRTIMCIVATVCWLLALRQLGSPVA
ncbi:MAG: anthrone oxygenase family protein [Planctomycetota bacterium]